jgi:hypothetical protein
MIHRPVLGVVAATLLLACGGGDRSLLASLTYTVDLDTTGRTVCEVRAVAFTDTSTGDPEVWAWDFGDGQTSTEQNPVLTPASATPAALTVTLEVRRGDDTDRHTEELVFPTC